MNMISLQDPVVTSFSKFRPRFPGLPPGSTLPDWGVARTTVASVAIITNRMVNNNT
jgi:hypothetical protein